MKRIHIQLTGKRLDDVVNEMTVESAQAVGQVVKLDVAQEEIQRAIRQSIRKVLEKYVHAYDLCGLATICHEAEEIDPWELQDQDKD